MSDKEREDRVFDAAFTAAFVALATTYKTAGGRLSEGEKQMATTKASERAREVVQQWKKVCGKESE